MQFANPPVRHSLKAEDVNFAKLTVVLISGAAAWGALGYLAIRCLTQFTPGMFH